MHVPSLHVPSLHGRRIAALVPHRHGAAPTTPDRASEEQGVRVTRAVIGLVIVSTVLFFALWTLAALGYADAGWWPALVILTITTVAALGAWLTFWLDR